jgi:hypothetical protein
MPAAPAAAQGVTIRGLLGAGLSFLHISDCSGECIVMAEGETENAQRFWFGISIPLGR